ncbi:MAG: EF-P beta-lysylation protein EpmB [Chromatiaceae bacterium]|jgi:EF-P beta-lysylation protein EpmB
MSSSLPVKLNPQIVARSIQPCQSPRRGAGDTKTAHWKAELTHAFRDVPALLRALGLEPADVPGLDPAPAGLRLLVPRGFAARMTPGDPADPLLRQVLPLEAEQLPMGGFGPDPVGDQAATRAPGLVQKYAGRALLMAQGACAIHCRYCFRRHYPYADLGASGPRFEGALETIGADRTLTEVILSGGDPLLLDDGPLESLLRCLDAIPHLRRLRIHSRLPVVLPERVTEGLCRVLGAVRLSAVVVIHANHPRELGDATAGALARLRGAGSTLLNQGVLLRGVNDDVDTLAELSERLFGQGVVPYYLHQVDPVQGAAHFQVPDREALALIEQLRARLPGYLVPRLVREVAGEACKRHL